MASPAHLTCDAGTQTSIPGATLPNLPSLKQPEDSSPFFLQGAPQLAGANWVKNFFARNFGISIISCRKLPSYKLRSVSSFKVLIPAKFAWLLQCSSNRPITVGSIIISEWTINPKYPMNNRPTNFSNTLLPPNTKLNNSSHKFSHSTRRNRFRSKPLPPTIPSIPNPRTIPSPSSLPIVPAPDSNWNFKTGIFPNLSGAIKYPNFTRSLVSASTAPLPTTSHPSSSADIIPLAPSTRPVATPVTTSSQQTTSTTAASVCLSPAQVPVSQPPISTVIPTSTTTPSIVPSTFSSAPTFNTPSFIDPLLPPAVKLTLQSATSSPCRYLLSRLRDHRIYENVRLYLAYLHNQDSSVCVDGKTKTNVLISIHQEGLPIDHTSLRQLFYQYHETFNIPSKNVDDDLSTYASYISSKRISFLQRSRSDSRNYFRP